MRPYIIVTAVCLGGLWAFDTFEFDGQHNHSAWQDANAVWQFAREQGQYFTTNVQRRLDKIMSGR